MECFFADYGQPAAAQEEVAVKRIVQHFNVSLSILRWSAPAQVSTGEIIGRNALLLFGALTQIGTRPGILVTGVHAGTAYFDCSPDFLNLLQPIIDGYSDGRVRVAAPFIGWSKSQILDFARSAHVPLHLTYSCEKGGSAPCGECLSCRDRGH